MQDSDPLKKRRLDSDEFMSDEERQGQRKIHLIERYKEITRIIKEETETIGFSKAQTTENEQQIGPVVKEKFFEFMHDKLAQVSYQLLDIYLEKLIKIVPVGDLEVVMISLLTEKLPWREESGLLASLRSRTQAVQKAEPDQGLRILLPQTQREVHRPRCFHLLPAVPRLHSRGSILTSFRSV